MTNAESLNLIVAVGAAVASILATRASFRSARSAETAQSALIEEHLRAGRREIAHLVAACSYEHGRIQSIAGALSIIDRSNAMFAGGLGGSRHKLAEDSASSRVARADELFSATTSFRDNPTAIDGLIREDIDRLYLDLTMRAAQLRALSNELERMRASHEAEMLQFRERAMAR